MVLSLIVKSICHALWDLSLKKSSSLDHKSTQILDQKEKKKNKERNITRVTAWTICMIETPFTFELWILSCHYTIIWAQREEEWEYGLYTFWNRNFLGRGHKLTLSWIGNVNIMSQKTLVIGKHFLCYLIRCSQGKKSRVDLKFLV